MRVHIPNSTTIIVVIGYDSKNIITTNPKNMYMNTVFTDFAPNKQQAAISISSAIIIISFLGS